MPVFGGLGFSLSLVLGFVLFALSGELLYLFWWKKRVIEDDNGWNRSNFLNSFLWKSSICNPRRVIDDSPVDPEIGECENELQKTLDEESAEAELMRLYNLAGHPRLLFTIKEETKEDLESDDSKSRSGRSKDASRTRSLSDLTETSITPVSSPQGLFSSSKRLEFWMVRRLNRTNMQSWRDSPPSKFKFLRDAEEKLFRKLVEEHAEGRNPSSGSLMANAEGRNPSSCSVMANAAEEREIAAFMGKERERPHDSAASQVLSSSSPSSPRRC